MTIKTKTQIKTDSDTTFSTNGVRDITAAKHRAFNDDMIDTFYMPVGIVMNYPKATPPTGWAVCNGQSLSQTDYPDLFAALGGNLSPYGGVSATHFNIPNITAGMSIVQFSTSPSIFSTFGAKGGEVTHVLTEFEMPVHTHIQNTHDHPVMHSSAQGTGYGAIGGINYSYDGKIMTAPTIATNQNAGSGIAHNNMPPYIVMSYIIKLK